MERYSMGRVSLCSYSIRHTISTSISTRRGNRNTGAPATQNGGLQTMACSGREDLHVFQIVVALLRRA